MSRPFVNLDVESLDPELANLKEAIEQSYRELEAIFTELETSEKRLKSMPGMMLPTLNVLYELGVVHSLRALELARASAGFIETQNCVAAFPVNRALFETWVALAYAEVRFIALAVDASKWAKYEPS